MISSEKELLGKTGEQKAFAILKKWGFILSRPDYSGLQKKSISFCGEKLVAKEDVEFEIKAKEEPFAPGYCGGKYCDFSGHGTDIYQIEKRMGRYRKHGIKQFLLIIQSDGQIFGQWLHVLESREHFDTPFKKRIYPLKNFFSRKAF